MSQLSIVIPTCNRATHLHQALQAIRNGTSCDYEVVVVDGASTDKTPALLREMKKEWGTQLRVIREPAREGFVRAVNKGLRAARGDCLIWLNDDARPLPGALDTALKTLHKHGSNVGLVGLFHRCNVERNIAYEVVHQQTTFRLLHVRGTLYANFGMGRRETFSTMDYFDEGYFLNAADPDFSLKVWAAGMRVVPAFGAYIDHDEHTDDRRSVDATRGKTDNDRLFTKWDLPPRNTLRNDFDPANPCTLGRHPLRRTA